MSAPIERIEETEGEEIESNDDVEPVVEHNTEEPPKKPPTIPEYASKSVKKLSKNERQMLLDGLEKGTEDPYFKVIRMANGQTRITKRLVPLLNDVGQAIKANGEKLEKKALKHSNGSRLTNEQLLMEHIFDLEAKFEAMRLKHKKLKRRYNELESAIYEDVDDGAKQVVEAHDDVPTQQIEQANKPNVQQTNETVVEQVEQPQQAIYERPRRGRTTWRDAISYMK